MADVFISYSRKDEVFGRKLYDELTEKQKRQVWMDWREIPQAEAWWRSIRKGIEESNNFVLIISPDSLASPICNLEILHAREHHKRIIPILYRDTNAASAFGELAARKLTDFEEQLLNKRDIIAIARDNWQEVSSINYIPFKEADAFEVNVGNLLEALDTDSDHVSQHTTLEQRAVEWHEIGRRAGFLLREEALIEAEAWLASSRGKKPAPTDLQIAYIQASRTTSTRQQRTTMGALTFGLVVALLLATLAFVLFQRSEGNLSLANERGTGVAQQVATATNAQGEALFQAATATSLLGLSNQRGTEVAQQAATATNAQGEALFQAATATSLLGLSNQRGTEVAQQAETAVAAQATSERNAVEAQSLYLAASARQALIDQHPELALVLALEANLIPQPSVQAQNVFADAAYAPGIRRAFEGTESVFSPDGRTILTGTCARFDTNNRCLQGEIVLWNVATGEQIRRFQGTHNGRVDTLAFSPDGMTAASASCPVPLVAGCIHGELSLWDVATGQRLHNWVEHLGTYATLDFSPDGQWILSATCNTAGAEGSCLRGELTLRNARTGEEIRRFRGFGFPVTSLAFSPDGTLAISGGGGFADDDSFSELVLWEVETGQEIRRFEGTASPVMDVAFSPNSQSLLASDQAGVVRLWEVATGQEIQRFEGHSYYTSSVDFSPDGQLAVSASSFSSAVLWNIETGEQIQRFESVYANHASFSPNGQMLLFSDTAETYLWDITSGSIIQRLPFDTAVYIADLSVDGTRMLLALGQGSILVDIETGQEIQRFEGHSGGVRSVALSPDGRSVLSGSSDQNVILWDVETGQEIRRFEGLGLQVWTLDISPDGSKALLGGGDINVQETELVLWDVETGQEIRRFEGHSGGVQSVAFSPDGRSALSGSSDQNVILWDVETGQEIRRFEGHRSSVFSVAFSPDVRTILSSAGDFSPANRDHTVRLWDIETGEEIRRFDGHVGPVRYVTFFPDGQTALSASIDGNVILWRIDTLDELIQWTHANRYVRELTCEEREQYRVQPFCDVSGVSPILTPLPTLTP